MVIEQGIYHDTSGDLQLYHGDIILGGITGYSTAKLAQLASWKKDPLSSSYRDGHMVMASMAMTPRQRV